MRHLAQRRRAFRGPGRASFCVRRAATPGRPASSARLRRLQRRARGLRALARVAAVEMVVDQPHRLHEGVDRGRADEASSRGASGPCDSATDAGVAAWPQRASRSSRARPRRRGRARSARRRRRASRTRARSSRARRALLIVDSILPRWRTMPASPSSRSTSAASKRATRSASKPAKAARKASRLLRMVSHSGRTGSPRGTASRTAAGRRRPGSPIPRRGSGGRSGWRRTRSSGPRRRRRAAGRRAGRRRGWRGGGAAHRAVSGMGFIAGAPRRPPRAPARRARSP